MTDRRIFGLSGRYFFDVPFAQLMRIHTETDDLFSQKAVFTLSDGGKAEASHSDAVLPLMPFLHALVQVPPAARSTERTPLVNPSQDDPIGIRGARAKLMWPDAALHNALGYVEAAHHLGKIDTAGATDAIRRLLLVNRAHYWGRGNVTGLWISPLAPSDLRYALKCALGAPRHEWMEKDETLLEFSTFGWQGKVSDTSLKIGDGQSVDIVRATIVPMKTASAFRLQKADRRDSLKSLGSVNRRKLQRIHEMLLPYEAQITILRAIVGWDMPVEQLWVEGPAWATHLRATLHAPPALGETASSNGDASGASVAG